MNYLTVEIARTLKPGDVLELGYNDFNQDQFMYTHIEGGETSEVYLLSNRPITHGRRYQITGEYNDDGRPSIVLYQFNGLHRDGSQGAIMCRGSASERVFIVKDLRASKPTIGNPGDQTAFAEAMPNIPHSFPPGRKTWIKARNGSVFVEPQRGADRSLVGGTGISPRFYANMDVRSIVLSHVKKLGGQRSASLDVVDSVLGGTPARDFFRGAGRPQIPAYAVERQPGWQAAARRTEAAIRQDPNGQLEIRCFLQDNRFHSGQETEDPDATDNFIVKAADWPKIAAEIGQVLVPTENPLCWYEADHFVTELAGILDEIGVSYSVTEDSAQDANLPDQLRRV